MSSLINFELCLSQIRMHTFFCDLSLLVNIIFRGFIHVIEYNHKLFLPLYITTLFLHYTVDGHWVASSVLLLLAMLCKNYCTFSPRVYAQEIFRICYIVRLLACRVSECSILPFAAFQKWFCWRGGFLQIVFHGFAPIYIPLAVYKILVAAHKLLGHK